MACFRSSSDLLLLAKAGELCSSKDIFFTEERVKALGLDFRLANVSLSSPMDVLLLSQNFWRKVKHDKLMIAMERSLAL